MATTRQGGIKGEAKLAETSVFRFQQKSDDKFPDTGKITAPSGNPAPGFIPPGGGGEASIQPGPTRLHYQPHSSGIILTNLHPSVHPSTLRRSLSDARAPSDAATFDRAYLCGDKQDLWTRVVHQTKTAPFVVTLWSVTKTTDLKDNSFRKRGSVCLKSKISAFATYILPVYNLQGLLETS